jgi:type VI secretion system secreted protein VgrG
LAQQINITIMVNGKEIKTFSSLTINQLLNDHHSFELTFDHDVIETNESFNINKSKDFLGKTITFSFNTLDSGKADQVFKGVVTNISFANKLSTNGDLIFKGYSTSIVLDTKEANASFLDETLSTIVKTTTKDASSNILTMQVNPTRKSPIPFVVKYRESNFGFIRRLAAEYGEWFFYDGNKLVFGMPSQGEVVDLQYPNNVSDYDLQMNVKHLNFEEVSYLVKDDKKVMAASSGLNVQGLDNLGKYAVGASNQLFNNTSTILSKRKFVEAAELDESVKSNLSNLASNLVILKASSDCHQVKVGATIKFSSMTPMDQSVVDYGKYIIIAANHYMDDLGNYKNDFEAIPATIIVPPNPNINKPTAEAQLAVVAENIDPDGMGRVKVQFKWQEDSDFTPWINVMTPNAGKKNRGFLFTPEVDDLVMVGFENNDPDRPYVQGSIHNGKAIDRKSSDKNQVKSISTRSGNTIYMNDREEFKGQVIKIMTDDDNYISIKLTDKKGHIQIFCNEKIEIDSKKEIIVKSAKSIEVSSGETINVKSEKITVEASDSLTLKAAKTIEIKSEKISIDASDKIGIKANSDVKVEGLNVDVKGSVGAKIAGSATLDLEGGGMTNIKGGLVKIN